MRQLICSLLVKLLTIDMILKKERGKMITNASIEHKKIDELTEQEMAFIHLSTSYGNVPVKKYLLRSTLSYLHQNINHCLHYDYSKQIIPYIGLCSMLEQLGTSYDIKGIPPPKYDNNLKRALVLFGGITEGDTLIGAIYAFRNGLLHNASLTSYDRKNNIHYHFKYDYGIQSIYQKSSKEWDGNYETFDESIDEYTSLINVELFKNFVYNCVNKAAELNQQGQLIVRLGGGVRQLFFDYILGIEKVESRKA